MTSLFSQWRTAGGKVTNTSTANRQRSAEQDDDDDVDQQQGPLTAPGGWGNLLTWRAPRRSVGAAGVEADEGEDIEGEAGSQADRATLKEQEPDSPQLDFATAKTKAKTAGSTRPRAPIPSFEPPPSSSASKNAAWSSLSSSSDGVPPKRSSLQIKGMDSADVSAELTAETSAADLSMDVGALDSAFETLTRIKAKDIAASHSTAHPTPSLPISSPQDQHIVWSKHKRLVSVSSTEAPSSRKASLAYHTPDESPTQPGSPSSWMQWGTSRIRATMPRGIASALLAVLGDGDEKKLNGTVDEGDENEAGAEFDDTIDADLSVLDLHNSNENDLEVIKDCIDVICGKNDVPSLLDTEGVFRVSPSSALLKSTKEAYARGETVLLAELAEQDKHLPAALLKDRLRIMRPPLVPESMYVDVIDCPAKRQDAIQYLRTTLLPELGRYNLVVLQQVMACANQVSRRSHENKMDSTNLALVLTPNLVNGRDVLQDMKMCEVTKEGDDAGQARRMTLGTVVQLCIEQYDEIFTGL